MGTTSKRGRTPTTLVNPFVIKDQWGDEYNMLEDTEHKLNIQIEDILIGVTRSFHADKDPNHRQDFINWHKMLRTYRNCTVLTRPSIQQYLRCSESQAKRYVRVMKLANIFLLKLTHDKDKRQIAGYVHLTQNQVRAGYTETEHYKNTTGEHHE